MELLKSNPLFAVNVDEPDIVDDSPVLIDPVDVTVELPVIDTIGVNAAVDVTVPDALIDDVRTKLSDACNVALELTEEPDK